MLPPSSGGLQAAPSSSAWPRMAACLRDTMRACLSSGRPSLSMHPPIESERPGRGVPGLFANSNRASWGWYRLDCPRIDWPNG
jgi:hypothetical protein